MAYETGTSTGAQDLIEGKLATFAALNGWTVTTLADGSKMFEKGAIFVAAFWDATNIYLRGATGVNAAAAYTAQPGVGQSCVTNNLVGAFTAYHIFEGVDFLHIVIQVNATEYAHLHIGELDKVGAWSGGQYYIGTYWDLADSRVSYENNYSHVPPWDSLTQTVSNGGGVFQSGLWLRSRQSLEMFGTVRSYSEQYVLYENSPNTFNQLTPLLPIIVTMKQGDGLYMIAGSVKNVRYINMLNHQAGDVITIAGEDWLVFPMKARTDSSGASGDPIGSHHQGYAYKREV